MEALGCQKSFRGQMLGNKEERPEVLGTLGEIVLPTILISLLQMKSRTIFLYDKIIRQWEFLGSVAS